MASNPTLAERIADSHDADHPIAARLSTNQKVIARVTDGIYRQPGSAIRELVSNAWDADATEVTVKTDAPRFRRMVIEDDGIGMTPAALAHLIENIGGSAKRTSFGAAIGVSSPSDPDKSPGGRPLIGKLGIGIFSVAQLTRRFQIITKTSGDSHRTIALVTLSQFGDEPIEEPDGSYNAGEVLIWREETASVEEHGTSLVLLSIRFQTRETLCSAEVWGAVDNPLDQEASPHRPVVPAFHIGRVDASEAALRTAGVSAPRRVPWTDGDEPAEAFASIVAAVWSSVSQTNPNPKLTALFDNYLQMVWSLSLSLPLPYCDGSILAGASWDWARFYELSNEYRGSARPLEARELEHWRLLGRAGSDEADEDFRVYVDNLELRRPIRFRGLPATSHALTLPIVFLGRVREEFSGIPAGVATGVLDFDAYLFWTPKIAPTEHQGALVRIHGSSGSLFDPTFFRYQVSEQTRLRQVCCEIFVREGLEGALNIDRESFNTSHPHMVVLTNWIHGALRQLATTQKSVAQVAREARRESIQESEAGRYDAVITAANDWRSGGEAAVPHVDLFGDGSEQGAANAGPTYHIPIFAGVSPPPPTSTAQRLAAVIQLLGVYGLLDDLSPDDRLTLTAQLLAILEATDG